MKLTFDKAPTADTGTARIEELRELIIDDQLLSISDFFLLRHGSQPSEIQAPYPLPCKQALPYKQSSNAQVSEPPRY